MKIDMYQVRLTKQLIVLIACSTVLSCLKGCDQTECKYHDDAPPYVDIESMSVQARDTVFERSKQYPFPFYISFSGNDYYATINHRHFSFPLLKAASACPPSPTPGYKGSKEKLDSIQINTLFKFNEGNPKGSQINKHFFVRVERDSFPTVNAYLNSEKTQLDDYVSLHLKTLPDTNRLKCAFLLQLENGETYRDTSRTIHIE